MAALCSAAGLSLVAARGALPSWCAWASHCGGLFRCGARALSMLWCMAPVSPRHVESSWTKNQTGVPCTGRQTCNHRTIREVPNPYYLSITDTCLPGNLRFPATNSCSEVKGLLSRKIWKSSLDHILSLMAKLQSSPVETCCISSFAFQLLTHKGLAKPQIWYILDLRLLSPCCQPVNKAFFFFLKIWYHDVCFYACPSLVTPGVRISTYRLGDTIQLTADAM